MKGGFEMRNVSVLGAAVILAGLCAGLLTGCGATGSSAPDPSAFEISYSNAELTRLDVEQNRLHYVWSMPKQKQQPELAKGLGDFNQHEFKTDLSNAQIEELRKWVAKHDVFSFAAEYPPADAESRDDTLDSRLTVVCGGRRHSVAWDKTSQCPKVKVAVGELIRIVFGIMAGQ
jgi:hypothetical protein